MVKILFSKFRVLFFLILHLSFSTKATDCLWYGGIGVWDEPTNWDCGLVPGLGDKAIITAGKVFLDIAGGVVIDELELLDGEIEPATTSDLIIKTSMVWKDGVILCDVLIDDGATLDISGAFTKTIGPGAGLFIAGTALAAWSAGLLVLDGPILNSGTFAIEFDGDIMGTSFFENKGALIKPSGGLDADIFVEVLNEGTIVVSSGMLDLNEKFTNVGGITVDSGTSLRSFAKAIFDLGSVIGAGSIGQLAFCGDSVLFNEILLFEAALEFCDDVVVAVNDTVETVGTIDFLSGSIVGMAILVAADTMNWEKGTITEMATVEIGPSGYLMITETDLKTVEGALSILGTATVTATALLEVDDPGTIDISGSLTLEDGADIGTSATAGGISNFGVLIKESTLTSSLSPELFNIGGITGIGNIDPLGTFTNTGIVAPGASPGLLSFTGDFSMGTQLLIELEDGTGVGIGHDQLLATGSISLEDTLVVTETGVVPMGSYTIIKCEGGPDCLTGTFEKTVLPSDYTITYHSDSVTLEKSVAAPVELLFFKGQALEEKVLLEWKTLSETDNAAFIIERSYDGQAYESLGTVAGAGTSFTQHDYHFVDQKINPALVRDALYYRLLQMDYDGQQDYSPVIAIALNGTSSKWSIQLLPTGTRETINLYFQNLQNKTVRIAVFDANGRAYYQKELELNANDQEVELNLGELPSGWYFIQTAIGRNFRQTERWWIAE